METLPAVSPESALTRSSAVVPRFSVIIPLEFHRGQGHDCLRAWTQGQDYSPEEYELILAIPPSLPEEEVVALRAMLRPHDQVIHLPHEHDIALCAAAAEHARGEILFFTESHCLPERDVLRQADLGFQAHPEWVGFSCESVPITHNLLSQVEAALYDRDIKAAMQHPWRKVLDQCFVVKREAYLATGGFDPTMGHFGEWLLSARFRQLEMNLGYWPAARVNHYYIGKLGEWQEFTEDFAKGEMRFMMQAGNDPAAELFDETPLLSLRHRLSRRRALRMAKMLYRDLRTLLFTYSSAGDGPDWWQSVRAWHWRDWFSWLFRGVAGPAVVERLSWNWRVWRARGALSWHLWKRDVPKADTSLATLCTALARRAGIRFLLRESAALEESAPSALRTEEQGTWVPHKFSRQVQLGFHALEVWDGKALCWSGPVAMVELPLSRGRYQVTLHCLKPPTLLHIQFYLNEKPISAARVAIRSASIKLQFRVHHAGMVRLGWICDPYQSPNDPRRLGIGIRSVTWSTRS